MMTTNQVLTTGDEMTAAYANYTAAMVTLHAASETAIAARDRLAKESARLINAGEVTGANEAARKASLTSLTATLAEVVAQAETAERQARHDHDVAEQAKKAAVRRLEVCDIIGRAGGVTVGTLASTITLADKPKTAKRSKADAPEVATPQDQAAADVPSIKETLDPNPPQAIADVIKLSISSSELQKSGEKDNPHRYLTQDECAQLEALLKATDFSEAQINGYLAAMKYPRTLAVMKLAEYQALLKLLPRVIALATLKRGEYVPGVGLAIFTAPRVQSAMAIAVATDISALGLPRDTVEHIVGAFTGVLYDADGGDSRRDTDNPDLVDAEKVAERLSAEFPRSVDGSANNWTNAPEPAAAAEVIPEVLVSDSQADEVRSASRKWTITGSKARQLMGDLWPGIQAVDRLTTSQARHLIDVIFPAVGTLAPEDDDL
jgi:hypothetical protein